MSDYRLMYRLEGEARNSFAEGDEVFACSQFGEDPDGRGYLVIGGCVAVRIMPGLYDELGSFYEETWGRRTRSGGAIDLLGVHPVWPDRRLGGL